MRDNQVIDNGDGTVTLAVTFAATELDELLAHREEVEGEEVTVEPASLYSALVGPIDNALIDAYESVTDEQAAVYRGRLLERYGAA